MNEFFLFIAITAMPTLSSTLDAALIQHEVRPFGGFSPLHKLLSHLLFLRNIHREREVANSGTQGPLRQLVQVPIVF